MAPTDSYTPRALERRAGVRWCPRCRALDIPDESCDRCAPVRDRAAPMRLIRGLTSIPLASESGLVHYQGEQTTKLVGLSLLTLIPFAAALALAWGLTSVATLMLGLSFIGLPALAFVDAHRAGRQRTSAPEHMPVCPPDSHGAAGTQAHSLTTERRPRTAMITLEGEATALGPGISSPLGRAKCLLFRLDIRAGQAPELVARYTSRSEFAITCADGTQAVLTGIIELTADAYQTFEASHLTYLDLHGTEILPALFIHGGWACELAVRHGDAISVQGPRSDERRAAPLGTSYRQSGAIDVLRGTPTDPVVVTLL